jgi:hypothetical protein
MRRIVRAPAAGADPMIDPKPFTWTATADQIIAKIQKCRVMYGTLH